MLAESAFDADTGSPDVEERPSKRVRLLQVPSPSIPVDPFAQLATEIIEKIFVSACPHVNFPGLKSHGGKKFYPLSRNVTDPAILSMVCRRWRDITTAYHSLWTNIVISASKISWETWGKSGFGQLCDCLLKSGTQPLKIQVRDDGLEDWMVFEIFHIFLLHSARWQTIKFDICPAIQFNTKFLQILNMLEGQLPLLEELQVCIPDSYSLPISTSTKCTAYLSAPLLHRLSLKGFSFKHVIQIPWTQISEVTFDEGIHSFDSDDFYDMMVGLAASIEVLRFSTHINYHEIRWKEKPVTLQKLQKLTFWHDSKQILSMFRCPALQWLDIENGNWTEITRFLDTSSCTLMHLHLGNISGTDYGRGASISVALDAEYCATLQNPSLSTLKSISLVHLPERILDILIFDSFTLFPSLETIHVDLRLQRTRIYDTEIQGDRLSSQAQGLRKIVQSRTQGMRTIDRESAVALVDQVPDDGRKTSLKNCFFTFRLQNERDGYQWDITPLEKLRSICTSRHVNVQVNIIYPVPAPTVHR